MDAVCSRVGDSVLGEVSLYNAFMTLLHKLYKQLENIATQDLAYKNSTDSADYCFTFDCSARCAVVTWTRNSTIQVYKKHHNHMPNGIT